MLKIIQFPNGKYALEHSHFGLFKTYADRNDLRSSKRPYWWQFPMYYHNAEFDTLEELENLIENNPSLDGKSPKKRTIKIL